MAPIDPRRRHRTRSPQGCRSGSRLEVLLRRPRVRADGTRMGRGRIRRRGRLSPSRALNTWESLADRPPRKHGVVPTAIRYPTRAALADALGRLERAGIPLRGAADHQVSESLYLSGPRPERRRAVRDRPRSAMAAPDPAADRDVRGRWTWRDCWPPRLTRQVAGNMG